MGQSQSQHECEARVVVAVLMRARDKEWVMENSWAETSAAWVR